MQHFLEAYYNDFVPLAAMWFAAKTLKTKTKTKNGGDERTVVLLAYLYVVSLASNAIGAKLKLKSK